MKHSLLNLLLLPAATLTLSQCVVVDGEAQGTTAPPANLSGSPMQSNRAYDIGLEKGFADGQGGLSRTPDRHAGSYPAAESDAFSIGYEAGYNKGSR